MKSLIILALLLPLPLPFSHVISWWVLLLYNLILLFQLRLVLQDRTLKVKSSMVNLLAGASLILFFLDAIFFSRHLIQVADHLTMFLILIKSYSLHGRRDYSQFLVLSFFLFLSVMASSTHVMVIPYFFFTLGAFLNLLMVWSQRRIIATRNVIIATLAASVLLAIPLFYLIPRVKNAYISGLKQRADMTSGLSDSITLGSITSFRDDRSPVLRVTFPDARPPADELRFRGITFDYTDGVRWEQRSIQPTGRIRDFPTAAAKSGAIEIFIHPRAFPHIFLPYRVTRTAFPNSVLRFEDGTLMTSRGISTPFTYFVKTHTRALPVRDMSSEEDWLQLPLNGVDYRSLAVNILGSETLSPQEAVRELLRFFYSEFSYTLTPSIPEGSDPTIHFLMHSKEGHCELFASSLALLLRSLEIPARVVGGYHGGELNTVQNYYIVRQSNAHAWIEAYINNRWEVFDPTPPEGIPGINLAASGFFSGFMDSLNYFWDRHILPFGRTEQLSLILAMRRFLIQYRGLTGQVLVALIILIIVVAAGIKLRLTLFRRSIFYRIIRRRVASVDHCNPLSLAPEEVYQRLVRLLPHKKGAIVHFMNAYTESAFGPSGTKRVSGGSVGILIALLFNRPDC